MWGTSVSDPLIYVHVDINEEISDSDSVDMLIEHWLLVIVVLVEHIT